MEKLISHLLNLSKLFRDSEYLNKMIFIVSLLERSFIAHP